MCSSARGIVSTGVGALPSPKEARFHPTSHVIIVWSQSASTCLDRLIFAVWLTVGSTIIGCQEANLCQSFITTCSCLRVGAAEVALSASEQAVARRLKETKFRNGLISPEPALRSMWRWCPLLSQVPKDNKFLFRARPCSRMSEGQAALFVLPAAAMLCRL